MASFTWSKIRLEEKEVQGLDLVWTWCWWLSGVQNKNLRNWGGGQL
jgi:hypothetical protein